MVRESGCIHYGGILQEVTVRVRGTGATRVGSNLASPPQVGPDSGPPCSGVREPGAPHFKDTIRDSCAACPEHEQPLLVLTGPV